MHKGDNNPVIFENSSIKDALFAMTDKGLGAVSVIDENYMLQGLMTDGDVRRGLENGINFLSLPVKEGMTKKPIVITPDKLAAEALHLMEKHVPHPITVLPVVDNNGKSVSS